MLNLLKSKDGLKLVINNFSNLSYWSLSFYAITKCFYLFHRMADPRYDLRERCQIEIQRQSLRVSLDDLCHLCQHLVRTCVCRCHFNIQPVNHGKIFNLFVISNCRSMEKLTEACRSMLKLTEACYSMSKLAEACYMHV